jgi:hypothetical protein
MYSLYNNFKKDDLPLPEWPTKYTNSPSLMDVVILDSATLPP